MIPVLLRAPARLATGLPACMGGWCTKRDQCHRHLTQQRDHVVERLCPTGAEQPEPFNAALFAEGLA